MPLDPDIRAYLDGLAAQSAPKLWEAPLAQLRENRRLQHAKVEPVPVGSVEEGLAWSRGLVRETVERRLPTQSTA